MAWMFAAVQDDITAGMHLHIHYLYAPPFPPTPFYPHPAIGMLGDNFARKTRIDNKKAARTGTKASMVMPPHLPYIGPFTHGFPMENTGVQVTWMGAGMGVHPFGGTGFVVIEGKPAAGFLSGMLGCWCVAPGFDMKVPFLGLDFVMIPCFRIPSVLYGPAPLAFDLFVLLISIIEDLLHYLTEKIPIPWLRTLATKAKDALLVGLEVAAEVLETGQGGLAEALQKGARYMRYAFIDGMVEWGLNSVLNFGVKTLKATSAFKWFGKSKLGGFASRWLVESSRGFLRLEATNLSRDTMNAWTNGDYGEYVDRKLESRADFGVGTILRSGAGAWGSRANSLARSRLANNYRTHEMHKSISARTGDASNHDSYRELRRNQLQDSRGNALTRRDDAFERHFNRHGPGGMTGFHGTRGDVALSDQKIHQDALRKGLKTAANKMKERTLGDMFDEFSKGLLNEQEGEGDEAGRAKALDDARKTFAKTLAKELFKL